MIIINISRHTHSLLNTLKLVLNPSYDSETGVASELSDVDDILAAEGVCRPSDILKNYIMNQNKKLLRILFIELSALGSTLPYLDHIALYILIYALVPFSWN